MKYTCGICGDRISKAYSCPKCKAGDGTTTIITTMNNTLSEKPLKSSCCSADVGFVGDSDGTAYFLCLKCEQPCEPYSEHSEEDISDEDWKKATKDFHDHCRKLKDDCICEKHQLDTSVSDREVTPILREVRKMGAGYSWKMYSDGDRTLVRGNDTWSDVTRAVSHLTQELEIEQAKIIKDIWEILRKDSGCAVDDFIRYAESKGVELEYD